MSEASGQDGIAAGGAGGMLVGSGVMGARAVEARSAGAGRARSTGLERVVAGLVAAGCLGVLVVAACLDPHRAHDGHVGTHEQLGMPACGWLMITGKPCPTCGMTTAFSHGVRLEVVSAVRAQPAGALLALCTAVTFWGALHVAWTGSRVWTMVPKLLDRRAAWVAGAVLLGSWAYKIAVFPKG